MFFKISSLINCRSGLNRLLGVYPNGTRLNTFFLTFFRV